MQKEKEESFKDLICFHSLIGKIKYAQIEHIESQIANTNVFLEFQQFGLFFYASFQKICLGIDQDSSVLDLKQFA